MLRRLVELWKDEAGPTSVEYALMLVLISIAAILAWSALGQTVGTQVTEVDGWVGTGAGPVP